MFPYFQHICFRVQVIDTGHFVTSGGNSQTLSLRVLDISVVGDAYVCNLNRCSIVNDRSPNRLVCYCNVSLCCLLDVPAKALRILFLLDTLSDAWMLCLLTDSEVSRWSPKIFGHCTRGSCESWMSISGWCLSWCVSGVNNVTDDFGAEINRKLSFRYAVISSR